jgi:thioredoxin-dependent peroxiredoxin
MAQLKAGDTAPNFSLLDQDGLTVSLSDFKGHVVLLYFYPKADTPGCTAQAVSVRDAREELQRSDVTAIGISPDAPQKQNKFAGKHNLGFRLLSDPDHKTADDYGVWGEKSMYGKKYEGIVRSSFLIDEEGKVIDVWYKVSPKDTVPKAQLVVSSRKK